MHDDGDERIQFRLTHIQPSFEFTHCLVMAAEVLHFGNQVFLYAKLAALEHEFANLSGAKVGVEPQWLG